MIIFGFRWIKYLNNPSSEGLLKTILFRITCKRSENPEDRLTYNLYTVLFILSSWMISIIANVIVVCAALQAGLWDVPHGGEDVGGERAQFG